MKVTGHSGCYQYNNRASMCQRQSDKLVIRVVFCDRVIMVLSVTDLLTVSVTINWCVFSFNLVPKIRNLIVRKPCFRRFKRLRKICRWYEQTPLILSRIVTEQFLIWLLVLLSLVAMCGTDVVKHPFKGASSGTLPSIFIQTILGINIGKYMFILMQDVFLYQLSERLRFRAELIHHTVTVVCYGLFLAYNQNVLLGLIGILMESTTIFDSVGRCLKEQDKRNTKYYRRLVLISCAMTICFRGIIPITFLIIATLQQTPFTMDYAPLTVFFLSIIFFSVVNVWLILTGFQRLVKLFSDKSDMLSQDYSTTGQPRLSSDGRPLPQTTARQIELSKNNLGYVRPYENKNISNTLNEKSNLNNHKKFPKETLNNQIAIDIFLPNDKSEGRNKLSTIDLSSSEASSDGGIFSNSDNTHSDSHLRDSSGSSESDNSARVLFRSPAVGQNNLVAVYARQGDYRLGRFTRSLSVENIPQSHGCQDNTSSQGADSSL